MKKSFLTLLSALLFQLLTSDAAHCNPIIEMMSVPRHVELGKSPVVINLEGVSKYTKFSDLDSLKVTKAYINGKGPFNVGVLLENGKLDPEFTTGIILASTMEKLGEHLRPGKIHHKIDSYKIGDAELREFVVEVYSPAPSEMNSPVPYLDGVITSGMLKNVSVSFNKDFSTMTLSK